MFLSLEFGQRNLPIKLVDEPDYYYNGNHVASCVLVKKLLRMWLGEEHRNISSVILTCSLFVQIGPMAGLFTHFAGKTQLQHVNIALTLQRLRLGHDRFEDIKLIKQVRPKRQEFKLTPFHITLGPNINTRYHSLLILLFGLCKILKVNSAQQFVNIKT